MPFRGQCLTHRAQLLQIHGAWTAALDEVARACEQLARPPGSPAIGVAHHVRGDLHRSRGELDAADAAYREATRWGHVPQPGLALLRLAQGRVDAAVAAIRLAVHEAQDRVTRPGALAASVEIHLAAGDVAAARAVADELATLAGSIGSRYLRTTADHAEGAVHLAEGDPRRRSRPCAGRRGPGASSTRPTRRPAPASSWASPAGPSATTTRPRSSSTRPVGPSRTWAPPSTSPPSIAWAPLAAVGEAGAPDAAPPPPPAT